MNTKLSRRVMASVLCLMMMFTLAFSSTEVLADSPNGNAGANQTKVLVVTKAYEKQGNSNVYAMVTKEEFMDVAQGENNDATVENVKALLDNPDDVAEGMKFDGWHCDSTSTYYYNDNGKFATALRVELYAQYTDENVYRYEGQVSHLRKESNMNGGTSFLTSYDDVMVLGDNYTEEQLVSELDKSGMYTIDDQTPTWTVSGFVTNPTGMEYDGIAGSFEARANYKKKSVDLHVSYDDGNYTNSAGNDDISKSIWVDQLTDDVVKAEVDKLNIQHTPDATFKEWEIQSIGSDNPSGVDAIYYFTAKYTNVKATLSATYVVKNQDGSYRYDYQDKAVTLPDLSEESIKAELNKLNLQHGLTCKGWDSINASGVHYTYVNGSYVYSKSVRATAVYDQYPSGIHYTYLNKKNEFVQKYGSGLYDPETTFGEIVDKETTDKRDGTVFYNNGKNINESMYPGGPSFAVTPLKSLSGTKTLTASYDDYRITTVTYPIASMSITRNSSGKTVKTLATNTQQLAIPNDVDTADEMYAFLQEKGLMKPLAEYQAVVSDVVGFDYNPNDWSSSSGYEAVTPRFKNGSPSVEYTPVQHNYDYKNYTFRWDGTECYAVLTCDGKSCNTGKKHTQEFKLHVTSKPKTAATCCSKGSTEYTAIGPYNKTSTKVVKDIPIDKNAHALKNVTWKWSANGKKCTVSGTCTHCKKKVSMACTVEAIKTTNPTCTKMGTTKYNATAPNGLTSKKTFEDKAMLAHKTVTKTTPATAKANGKVQKVCSDCGKVTKTTVINKIGSMKLSVSSATYNGKEIKPTVTVVDSKGKTINPKYYTVTYAKNKDVGTAKVTVKFKSLYKGSLSKTFKIVPKKTTVTAAASPKKGSLKVNWTALTASNDEEVKNLPTGYEIQVASDAKFKNVVKTVKVNKANAAAKTITGLKKGKYYVRIRTYKTNDNKTFYNSAWANYKTTAKVK